MGIPTFRVKSFLFLLIILINGLVYYPSLFHAPKGDHDIFLIEMAPFQNLKDLISHSYSFNRTRFLGRGDEFLFRPLLFATLSLEQWLYGYHFFWWQLTGLCLHLVLVYQLIKMLENIFPSYFAYATALNFSVIHLSQELVIWPHLSGYLVALIVILKSLRHFLNFLDSNYKNYSHIWKIIIYLTIGTFFYEFTLVILLILIAAIIIHKKIFHLRIDFVNANEKSILKRFWEPMALMIPLIIYAVLNSYDYIVHKRGISVGAMPHVASPDHWAAFFLKIISLVLLCPILPIFLPIGQTSFLDRLELQSLSWSGMLSQFETKNFLYDLNLILFLVCVVVIAVYGIRSVRFFRMTKVSWQGGREASAENNRRFFGIISLFISLIYIFIIVVMGRLSNRGGILHGSLYYFYPIMMFNSIFIYTLLSRFKFFWQKDVLMMVMTGLCLSVFLNGYKDFLLNNHVKKLGEQFFNNRIVPIRMDYLSLWHEANGSGYHSHGDIKKAEEEYKKALELNPQQSMVRNNLGIIYMNRGQYPEAEKEFLLESTKYSYELVYYNLGLLYSKENRWPEAEASWKRALELNPRYADAYIQLFNYYYLNQKNYSQAKRYLNQLQNMGINIPPEILNRLNKF